MLPKGGGGDGHELIRLVAETSTRFEIWLSTLWSHISRNGSFIIIIFAVPSNSIRLDKCKRFSFLLLFVRSDSIKMAMLKWLDHHLPILHHTLNQNQTTRVLEKSIDGLKTNYVLGLATSWWHRHHVSKSRTIAEPQIPMSVANGLMKSCAHWD